MPRIAYVNGHYVPFREAGVHIEDRGFQFADGVYEVIGCIGGVLADEAGHLDRLERSLSELEINMPVSRKSLAFIMREVVRRNKLCDVAVYIQVTRGEAKRNFAYPSRAVQPSLIVYCWPHRFQTEEGMSAIKVITVQDQRWKRRDIKSIALLPQTIAAQAAVQAGVDDAWMVDAEGLITEGSASNAWIVKDGALVTRFVNTEILKGVTRCALFELIQSFGLKIEERAFGPEEAYEADEAFNSSATKLIAPVVEIDGHKIGVGKVGPITKQLLAAYRNYAQHPAQHVNWQYQAR